MVQQNLAEPYDPEAVADYRQEAHVFLSRAWKYLAAGDLHQASEKGWGAAAWMAKAVAVTHGWVYQTHAEFGAVLNNAKALTGNDRIFDLRSAAYSLHVNYYTRKRFLSHEAIEHDLGYMTELLDTLEPLTTPAANGQTGG